jgi:hypothetical protein
VRTKASPLYLSFNSSLRVDFQGRAGDLRRRLDLLHRLDEQLGLSELIEQYLADPRGNNVQIPLADSLRQPVFKGWRPMKTWSGG